jgi:endonuclease/exonuclease/phosphatase (EEP) superfamily protein YafD
MPARSLTRLFLAAAACAVAGCVSIPPTLVASQESQGDTARQYDAECPSPAVAPGSMQRVSATPLRGDTFSLLSWNIHKLARAGWENDLRALAVRKDLVLLQEATADAALGAALRDNGVDWEMLHAFTINGHAAGVLTAARATPARSCGLRVPEPVIRLPKTALVSYFPLAGSNSTLAVANLHGINVTFGLESYGLQLARLRETLAGHDGPLIVVGDFNCWTGGRERVMSEFAQSLGLRQADLYAQPARRFFGRAIDHIFYRNLELVEARAVAVSSSDHDPLVATFRIARGRQL